MSQATFALRGRNPDVLSCIANLSSDEVFTPPEFANQMLDTLETAWAEANDGRIIWADPTATFLDPFTKSGVFLREITSRLTEGLATTIPDLKQRVDHILTTQVFGIGITQLTSMLARRSVYCSKWANGRNSVASSFTTEDGNIWFERTEHIWTDRRRERRVHPTTGEEVVVEVPDTGRCSVCGAREVVDDKLTGARRFFNHPGHETHAYKFIHHADPHDMIEQLFGAGMQFDVVIGNPPYQMTGGAGGSSDSSIYQLFVEQAIRLEPRMLTMVIPSRWLAGGRGLDTFRREMLGGGHLSHLVDYTKMSTAFPGVDFEGGVGYFLWDQQHSGDCAYTLHQGDEKMPTVRRDLGVHDIFVRDLRAVRILDRVRARGEPAVSDIFTNREPFKLESNFRDFRQKPQAEDIPLHYIDGGKRGVGYVSRSVLGRNPELADKWKVLVPKAYGERGAIPAMVLGRPLIGTAPSAATGSFLFFYVDSRSEAESLQSYYSTKFFRFLVSLRKITQDAFRPMYSWVPMQTWDRPWTDAELYAKYGLTQDEIDYIETVIRPMELGSDQAS